MSKPTLQELKILKSRLVTDFKSLPKGKEQRRKYAVIQSIQEQINTHHDEIGHTCAKTVKRVLASI